jgi:hypothetical protein
VTVSRVLEGVSVISVKITFGEIQLKNAMVSHRCCFIGCLNVYMIVVVSHFVLNIFYIFLDSVIH